MTEPVLFRKSFLIALVAALQSITPPIVAVAALFIVKDLWQITFDDSPNALAVIVAMTFLTLIRPPRDLSAQMARGGLPTAAAVVLQWCVLLAVLLAIGAATDMLDTYPDVAFYVWAVATPVLLVGAALLMHAIMRRLLINSAGNRRVIIAGYNSTSVALARRLQNSSVLRMNLEGFFDDRGADRLEMEDDARLLGRLSELPAYARQHSVDVIFVALPIGHLQRVIDLLDDLRDTTASIYYVPDIFVFDLIQARSSELHGIPVVAMCETPFQGYRGVVKRLSDGVLALIGLLVLSPVFAIVAALVRLSSPGPAIFRQRRYGLDGQEIIVYKFRTMRVTEDGAHVRQASRGDPRITPVGAFLRRSSLDEIPQLINVLQGRMSLVGPRPHAVAHNEQYRKLIKGYMLRHKVLPGITGLAQVNGCRGETSTLEEMEARVRYDLDYLRHWSLMLDIKILIRTVIKMFRDDKAY